MKNVTIAGGLLFVLGMGAGPMSIDALRRKKPAGPPRSSPTISINPVPPS
jgi:hypothetical protein